MEVRLDKNNNLLIKCKLSKNETWKISKGRNFRGVTIYKKTQLCQGYSSKTEGNKHIILLDWDDTYKSVVLEDISHIRRLFSLPPAYLLTTKQKEQDGEVIGNFHAVILSTHTSKKVFEIMSETNVDSNFITSILRKASKSWVLRLSPKKKSGDVKFLEIIGNGNLDREISTAHKVILSKFFPEIKHPKYINEDGNSQIKIQIYETKGK